MFTHRVQADPILQPEQHPQQRECADEDERVQERELCTISNTRKKVQWQTLLSIQSVLLSLQELESGTNCPAEDPSGADAIAAVGNSPLLDPSL